MVNNEQSATDLYKELAWFIAYIAGLIAFIAYMVNLIKNNSAWGFGSNLPMLWVNRIGITLILLFIFSKGGAGMLCITLGIAQSSPLVGYLLTLMLAPHAILGMGPAMYYYTLHEVFGRPYPQKAQAPEPPPRVHETAPVAPPQPVALPKKRLVGDPSVFKDLIGVDDAIKAIRDALEIPILYPEVAKEYKLSPPKGILLYGPPGTGKSSLAYAVSQYFGYPFCSKKCSDFVGTGVVGSVETAIRSFFDQAREKARLGGGKAIIFIDEIDVLGQKRDGKNLNRLSDIGLTTLLEELDGFKKSHDVYFIAATNRKDMLDAALLRPGRLDRHIELGYPGLEDRVKLYKHFLAGVPFEEGDELKRDPEGTLKECAAALGGISPAEIKQICENAKTRAANRAIERIKQEKLEEEQQAAANAGKPQEKRTKDDKGGAEPKEKRGGVRAEDLREEIRAKCEEMRSEGRLPSV